MLSNSEFAEKIIEKAKLSGASIAGVANVESLKVSPSHQIYPKIGMNLEAHWENLKDDTKTGEVTWPSDAVSVVVIGVEHNADKPELDWFDGKGTPGNRVLIRINKKLSEWIENTFSVKTYKLPYFIEKGGIFLKDAAVMAGLGCIGKNNLVITPEYGPRVRFRSILMNREVEVTEPIEFNPCEDCIQPCRKACPVKAFQNTVYSEEALGQSILPGINGTYNRVTCNLRMKKAIEKAVDVIPVSDKEHQDIKLTINAFEDSVASPLIDHKESDYSVKYCRRCELSCPVGK
ncbi:epoxyqueuosine reductase [Desulfococcaceae bacterium HSG7]|nr:epoxyqueuosine reductase [Desulfococcaceae bacterium HSG7]